MADEQFTFGWEQGRDTGGTTPEGSDGERTPQPEVGPLADRLGRLAERGVYLGTSSWKYPGWVGKIYHPDRYSVRGKFSKKRFDDTCLGEYAGIFPTVCGDFAFYRFPTSQTWKRIFDQVPSGFRFSLKVPEDVTVDQFPKLPRYGKRAGKTNDMFMDAPAVNDLLLARLEPYQDRLGVLIFQFGTIHHEPYSEPRMFAGRLGEMLAGLPTDRFRFAVEVRNPDFLEPDGPYLETLREHGVAHCLSSWARMPALDEQMRIPGVFTAPHAVARLLLRPGRSYQEAVDAFSPYDRVREPCPAVRASFRELVEAYLGSDHPLFVFVNNRLEGNAIDTISSTIESIE